MRCDCERVHQGDREDLWWCYHVVHPRLSLDSPLAATARSTSVLGDPLHKLRRRAVRYTRAPEITLQGFRVIYEYSEQLHLTNEGDDSTPPYACRSASTPRCSPWPLSESSPSPKASLASTAAFRYITATHPTHSPHHSPHLSAAFERGRMNDFSKRWLLQPSRRVLLSRQQRRLVEWV